MYSVLLNCMCICLVMIVRLVGLLIYSIFVILVLLCVVMLIILYWKFEFWWNLSRCGVLWLIS